jgi:hypothetical protein
MDEMGHTDPDLALKVYRQSMRRDDGEKDRLQALVNGAPMAVMAARPIPRRQLSSRRRCCEALFSLYRRGWGARARQDSNLRLLPPEGSALSTELRAPGEVSVVPGW